MGHFVVKIEGYNIYVLSRTALNVTFELLRCRHSNMLHQLKCQAFKWPS